MVRSSSKPAKKKQQRKRRKPLSQIGRILEERGLRPGWVVERSGITYSRLHGLRKGGVRPRKSEIVSLAKCMGVMPTELVKNFDELTERTSEPRVLTKQEAQYVRSHAGKVPVLEMQRHLKMKRIHLLRYIHENNLPLMKPGAPRKKRPAGK